MDAQIAQMEARVVARLEACEALMALLLDKLTYIEERVRSTMALEAWEKAKVMENPMFEE